MRHLGLLVLVLAATAACAAPPETLRVDKKGVLVVPAAVMKKLSVKVASNGMVCVQFPKPPQKPIRGHEDFLPDRPPRIFPTIRPDGSLKIPRQRLVPGTDFAPGPPGTLYTATSEDGRLVLTIPSKKKK